VKQRKPIATNIILPYGDSGAGVCLHTAPPVTYCHAT